MAGFKKTNETVSDKRSESKTVAVGAVWQNDLEDRDTGEMKKVFSIKLGNNKNKDPKYNYSVELTVKDNEGNVVIKQTDGYINMYKPTNSNAPDSLKFNLTVKRQ